MKPGSVSFRPPWWGVLLAAAGCAAGIALGNWQSGRAAEKRAAGASVQRVDVRGEFLSRFTVFLDNKVYRSLPGYQVVQAFRTQNGKHILVNRGWVAAGRRREQLPEVRTPAGEVAVAGVRLERFAHAYEPSAAKYEGPVWQNVTVEAFAAWSGLALEPWVIEQHSALADGLARDWPRLDSGADMHQSYALQWYSLAALCVILLVVLGLRRDAPAAS